MSRLPVPLRFACSLLAIAAALVALPALAAAATITVNTTADNAPNPGQCDGAPGDCSLRQAISKANALGGQNEIVLPAGHYALTIDGNEEDQNEEGDLDVAEASEVSIVGAGARTTIVDANAITDRVFEVRPLASLSLSRLTVTNGLADDEYGGGIYAAEAKLVLDRVTVSANVANKSGRGGGLALEDTVTSISASAIVANRNSGDGGGIWGSGGEISIVNTTIANNVVETALYPENPGWGAFGGGMEIDGGHLALQNVTISGNSVTDNNGGSGTDGPGIEYGADTSAAVNTIVYGNTSANPDNVSQCSGTLESEGHNLEQAVPDASESRCFESSTDLIANPLLGLLANNGGDTDTMALLSGSPAINGADAGRCPATDQRGLPRPQLGGCDIGAFEVQPVPPPPPPVFKPTIKRSGPVTVKKAGKGFLVKTGFLVSCPAGGPKCTATVKIRANKPKVDGKAGASAAKKILVAKKKFTIAAGKKKALKLKLNRKGAKLLEAAGKLRAQIEVVSRAGTEPPVKAKRTATLKLPAGK